MLGDRGNEGWVLLGFEVVAGDFVEEALAREAEGFGGVGAVAGGLLEGALDFLAFEGFEFFLQGLWLRW